MKRHEILSALNDNFFAGSEFTCPFCGGQNVHLCGAAVSNGKDDYHFDGVWDVPQSGSPTYHPGKSDEDGTVLESPNRSRGGDVLIKFTCEYGCTGVRSYLFHKGTTYVTDKNIPAASWGYNNGSSLNEEKE